MKVLLLKVIAAFTKESIAETKEKYGLKEGDVVFLENPSGGGAATAQILVEARSPGRTHP